MPKHKMSFQDLPKIAEADFGKNLASHFQRPLEDRETLEFAQSRARVFTSNGQDFSSSLMPSLAIDFGGMYFNESSIVVPIDGPNSDIFFDALSRRLGTPITANNAAAAFVIHRFVDPMTSRRFGMTALSYTEYVFVLHFDLERNSAVAHQILPSGLSTISRGTLSKGQIPKIQKLLDQYIPRASSLFKGPPNRLLSWNGKQWGIARIEHASFAESAPSGSSSTFAPASHQLVNLIDFQPESFDARLFRSLATGIEHTGFMTPERLEVFGPSSGAMTDIVIERNPNDDGSTGGGGPGVPSKETQLADCHDPSYDRAACVACCDSNQRLLTGIAVTVAVASLATGTKLGGGYGAIGGLVVGALLGIGIYLAADFAAKNCRAKCPAPLGGGVGGHISPGGGQHTK
jgi:hypothetical protein